MLPPPTITSPDSPPAELSCVPPAVTIRVALCHPAPSAVVTSASIADPSDSTPLHSELSSAFSSSSAPSARYPSPCSLVAYLMLVPFLALSSARMYRRRCCRRRLCLRPRLAVCPPFSVPFTPPCSAAPTPAIPRSPAATLPALRAPSPGPGRQYFPQGRRCRRSDGRGEGPQETEG